MLCVKLSSPPKKKSIRVRRCKKLVEKRWNLKKSGLKPVLLLHSPFLLPYFFRREEITSCRTFSVPIDFHQ